MTQPNPSIPRTGMLAIVRNRRALVTAVEPYDAGVDGRLHLVSLEYTSADGPLEDRLLWEREPGARVLEPAALPDVTGAPPDPPRDYDALVRAARWTALTPFVDPDGREGPLARLPIASPFHGALQVEDFQLVPLLRALQMPRIALLLADDVGLGKTIEAGLILTELLLRRRIRRVLIACPASLRRQWRDEMRGKFALSFDIVDRERTHLLRKSLGLDANPWRTFSRAVTSYFYLKQPDVLEEFRAASTTFEGAPHPAWDLLIVDEAHNLAPAAIGEESDLSRMLRAIAPYFEHKLFLTATPHNGHTGSFTGLLESLDPVRFAQTNEMTPAERSRVEEVVVRRLKREINERTDPRRFCDRRPEALSLRLSAEETALAEAFRTFRAKLYAIMSAARRSERQAGAFAVEILGKRLLSCPVAFADSWHRYKEGMAEEKAAEVSDVRAAQRAAEEETGDDRETEGRTAHAARTVGAWLKPLADRLVDEIAAIERALRGLGLGSPEIPAGERRPLRDARFDALCEWIEARLRASNGAWRDDERAVVFTEYKTTLDSLEQRLRSRYPEAGRVRVLYGGMDDDERDEICAAINDPADPVRVLVATDAAAEGLNLQETARYLLHFDVPWNPARLEQRNGRLDRHGQARDVIVHHFVTDDDADLSFLAYVVGKVEAIREDLGSTGEVFDAAFQRRFVRNEDRDTVQRMLDAGVERARGRAAIPRAASVEMGEDELKRLEALAAEVDLDPTTLRDTLEVALGLGIGLPRLSEPDARGRSRLLEPLPPRWNALLDDTLRLREKGERIGRLPGIVFDPERLVERRNGRAVFRAPRDTALLHLGHPVFQRGLALLAQARFPGADAGITASRWTVRRGQVPEGTDAVVLLTLEELAANDLRETFHHWMRTLRLPIRDGRLGEPLPHEPASALRTAARPISADDVERARELWDEVAVDLRRFLEAEGEILARRLAAALAAEGREALAREQERFRSRQGELSHLIEGRTLDRLEREIGAARMERRQLHLLDDENDRGALSLEELEEELARRRSRYEELRERLRAERDRVIERLLPKRYALRAQPQVFPVAVEIRLPEARR